MCRHVSETGCMECWLHGMLTTGTSRPILIQMFLLFLSAKNAQKQRFLYHSICLQQ